MSMDATATRPRCASSASSAANSACRGSKTESVLFLESRRPMTTLAMPKPHKDRGMEGLVAKWYASNTAEVMTEYAELARRIHSDLAPGSNLFEVAPGPGYFCIELSKLGQYTVTGLDI